MLQLASSPQRKEVSRLLRLLSEEHKKWEGDEASEETLDEEEFEQYQWADTAFQKQFYPLLYIKKEEIQGLALLMQDEKEQSRWHILEFIVDPKFRRQGVGNAFVQKIREWMVEDKAGKTLETASHVANQIASAFWASVGAKTFASGVSFKDRTIYGVGKFDRHCFQK